MKKFLIIFMCLLTLTGCKEDKKKNDTTTTTKNTTTSVVENVTTTTKETNTAKTTTKKTTKKTTTKTTTKAPTTTTTTTTKKTTTTTTTAKPCDATVNGKCYELNKTYTYNVTLQSNDNIVGIDRLFIDILKQEPYTGNIYDILDLDQPKNGKLDSYKMSPDYDPTPTPGYVGYSYGIELRYDERMINSHPNYNPNYLEDFSSPQVIISIPFKVTSPGVYKIYPHTTTIRNDADAFVNANISDYIS